MKLGARRIYCKEYLYQQLPSIVEQDIQDHQRPPQQQTPVVLSTALQDLSTSRAMHLKN